MKRKSRSQPPAPPAPISHVAPAPHAPAKPAPAKPPPGFAGKPLDGSQFRDVIEEQKDAEQRPTREGR